jgi:hypothetical protein
MLRATAAIAILCLTAFPAQAFQVSCDDVRAYVAQHGKAKALAFALKNGATFRQINEARKCLKN